MTLANTALIILAAGKSTRMGFPKGLLPYKGKKLLEYQIRSFFSYGGKEVLVVLGEHRESYLRQIPSLKNCELVFNDHVEQGPYSSLLLALESWEKKKELFLLPLDTPAPSPSVWRKLAKASKGKAKVILPEYEGRGGHPIILRQGFFQDLLKVDPLSDQGRLDLQIQKLSSEERLRVAVTDKGIRLNINSLNDLGGR